MNKLIPQESVYSGQNRFNNIYYLTGKQLEDLYYYCEDRQWDIIAGLRNLFSKIGDCITSIRFYPFKSNGVYGIYQFADIKDSVIRIGGRESIIGLLKLYGKEFKKNIVSQVIGTIYIPEPQSFVDLEPYTQIQLYLPFMDFLTLPVDEVAGRFVTIRYAFDFNVGTATAFVLVTDDSIDGEHLLAMKSNKISADIAFGSDRGSDNAKAIIDTCIDYSISMGGAAVQVAGGAAKHDPQMIAKGGMQAASATAGAGKSIANAMTSHYSRGGNVGGFSTMYAPPVPYAVLTKPKLVPVDEEEYAHIYGKPLYEERVLASLRGFTVIDDIHLTGFDTALDEEVNEIENLLKSGVHF